MKNKCRFQFCLLAILLLLINCQTRADIRLPKFVGSNMVLQRDTKLNFWGWADANEAVTIHILNKTYSATTTLEGKWRVTIPPLKAGGPIQIVIEGKNKILLENVLVGDVWLCSGQSNMEFRMEQCGPRYAEAVMNSSNANIRLLTIARNFRSKPVQDVETEYGGWQAAGPASVKTFSAVAYFFGRRLQERYKIPIGLIADSWGGTPAEAWTSAEALKPFPNYYTQLGELSVEETDAAFAARYSDSLTKRNTLLKTLEQNAYNHDDLSAPDLNEAGFSAMNLPNSWETVKGMQRFDGIVWFRKKILLSQVDGHAAKLFLGKIDDNDSTYFNGVKIGTTQKYDTARVYIVPAGLLKPGENIIAVKVIDTGGSGGFWGDSSLYKLELAGQIIPLTGEWKFKPTVDFARLPVLPIKGEGPNFPSTLYNGMIAPLLPMAIKGVIWYQGESNADRAKEYQKLFPNMIQDWRTRWQLGSFPFLFVQLANYYEARTKPDESDWAELREAQCMTLSLPNTGMAVTVDIGEGKDIHPKNKQDVGERLALAAGKVAYSDNSVEYSGPLYKNMQIEGNTIRVTFTHATGGLLVKGDALKWFAVAGEDHIFYWAQAKIEGSTVVVSSTAVNHPVAVRYAWQDNPEGANLYNKAGIPASPFRSDAWPRSEK